MFCVFYQNIQVVLKVFLRKKQFVYEDNIKRNIREVGCGDVDWIPVAHDK